MDLKRLDNENYLTYLKRIAELKRLAKIGYDELGDLLLGEDNVYSSENIRKFWYIFDKIIDNIDDSVEFTEQDLLNELDSKKLEIQKERYKVQATKLELNRSLRQESRFELFYENIRDSIIALDPPEFKILKGQNTKKKYVLGTGDYHYGAKFKSENNEYSREIFKQRLEELLAELVLEIDKNNINEIKMINVADSIQGLLRYTDLQINDIAVVDCVVEVSRLIAEFLKQLSVHCIVEYYHCPAANHSQTRPLGSKASEIATEDMERIIVNYVSDLLIKNDRVKVFTDLNKEYVELNIFDFKAIVLHGHQIKSVPNVIKDLSNLHRKFYDYAFLGHRHSANEIIVGEGLKHNIEILTCPSFVGSDPFADTLHVGSKAMCKLYEFDINNGHTGSKNIILN